MMKLDELASRAGQEVRGSTSGLQPPSITEVHSSRRRRWGTSVVLGAFVGTLAVIGAVAIWPLTGDTGPVSPPQPATTIDAETPVEPSTRSGSGLLIAGDDALAVLSPEFTVRKILSGVTDAVLLPDGQVAALTWAPPNESWVGAVIGLLDLETLAELGRVNIGVPVEVIGPNPISGLAVSRDGGWLVGLRWPDGERVSNDVELWTVELGSLRLLPHGVSLPGCGVGWPAPGADPSQFTVLCVHSGDIRLVTLDPEGNHPPVAVVPLPAVRSGGIDLNGNPLRLDSMLGLSTASDGTIYMGRGGGEIQRFDPEGQDVTKVGDVALTRYLPGVQALSPGGDILYVGSGPLSDREGSTGRRQADQLHAIDLSTGNQLWEIDMPQPFTSLAVGSDGTLYAATFPHGNPPTPDPSLMRIDPDDRTVEVVIDELSITPGPIIVLP